MGTLQKAALFCTVLAIGTSTSYSRDQATYDRYDEQPGVEDINKSTDIGTIEMVARAYCKKRTATCLRIAHRIGDPLFEILGLDKALIDTAVLAWIGRKQINKSQILAQDQEQ